MLPQRDVGAARIRTVGGAGAGIEEKGGVFFAREAFRYPVVLLRERPEDVSAKAALSRFETTPGTSLISAPDLKARTIREYLEARDVYRAIGERGGVALPLGPEIDERRVRIYFADWPGPR